jgi:hypothetical protein
VAATTASEMATTTAAAGMAAATTATSTVSSSGTGRHRGTHSECGHGEDLERPAQKSCLSHLARHVTSLRRCTPVGVRAALMLYPIRRSATAFVQAPGTATGSLVRYGLSMGTFPVMLFTVPTVKNVGTPLAMTWLERPMSPAREDQGPALCHKQFPRVCPFRDRQG